jgi:hypothetical protein
MRLPTKDLCKRLVERGFAKPRKDGQAVRATANIKLASLETTDIVRRYNAIIRGLVNYYTHINQRSDL